MRGWCAPARGAFGLLESSGQEGLRALETYMRAQDGDSIAFGQAHQSLMARGAWGHALIARWEPEVGLLSVAQTGDAHWIWARGGELLAWRWGRTPLDDYYEGPPVVYGGGSMLALRGRRERTSWLGMLEGMVPSSPWPYMSALAVARGDQLVLLTRGAAEALRGAPRAVLGALEAEGEQACGRLLELGRAEGAQGALVVWL